MFVSDDDYEAAQQTKTKVSGYGAPTSSVTPQKAPPRTEYPVDAAYRPGGLSNAVVTPMPYNPAPVAPQYGGYEPTDYELGLENRITPQQFTEFDRYQTALDANTYSPYFENRGYTSPLIAPYADDSAQTSELPPLWGQEYTGPTGFLPNLGVAAASFGNIMDAPREYLTSPLAGNLLSQFDSPLDIVSSLGKGPLGVIQQGLADTATPGGYQAGRENWDTQIGKLPEPLQVGANIAIDPLTWLGPGAIKGGLQGSRFANVADTLLTQPASVGVGQVVGGTGGAAAAEYFDLGPGGTTAAILAGTILGGGLGPAGVRGLSTAARNAPDAARNLAGSNPFAAATPSSFDLPVGAIDPSTGRAFEWQAPMGGADDVRPENLRRISPGDSVSGYRVGEKIDNLPSLSGIDYEPLGLREVPLSQLEGFTGQRYPIERVPELAEQIRASGRIDPLIVMVGQDGKLYVLEGQHRFQAMQVLGAETIPALVGREVKQWPTLVKEDFAKVSKLHPDNQNQMLSEASKIVEKEGVDALLDYDMGPLQSEWDSLAGIIKRHASPETPSASGLNQPTVDVPFTGQRAILDALQEQIRFRESGAAEELIRQGRRTQAAGISGALAQGGTLDEMLSNVSEGMRVGRMLPDGAPLNLTPETIQSATNAIAKMGLEGDLFDSGTSLRAFNKLLNGQKLQPKEIKLLGKVFGSDVEDLIRRTNANRIAIKAELTPADLAEINRRAVVDGKRVAKLEVEAEAQHKLANQLRERARMNPTNKQLAKAADDAQARALKLEADADRYLRESIQKSNLRAEEQQTRALARAEQKAVRADVREQEALDKWQAGIEARLVKNAETKAYVDSGEKALDQAIRAIEKSDMPEPLKATAREMVNEMVKIDRAILDNMGGDAPGFLRTAYAGATGELTDSWTSQLYAQTSFLRGALEDLGYNPEIAGEVSSLVRQMEVSRRWGPNPPKHIVDSIEQAKQARYGDSAIRGAAMISQEFKNLMFGPIDIGIAGIQGLAAGNAGLPAMLAGLANRLLNVKNLGVDTSPGALVKRAQYGLDGRVRSAAAYTGVTGVSHTTKAGERVTGTLLRHIPGLSKVDERYIARWIAFNTDVQFRKTMGFLGDLTHEGQLVLARLGGADITDPAVRRSSAEYSNAITSAGKLAQRAGRAEFERAAPMSASMIRAQAQNLSNVAKLFLPGTPRHERIFAASMVVSYGVTLAAIGKVLNDLIGTDDFEFDPSKPGAWTIRLPSGHIINPFPQTQLFKLLVRAGRVLAEEGDGEQDPEMIAKAYLNFGLSRMSPAVGIAAQGAGVGFDPESGWRYGDLGEGKSWWEKLLMMAPEPPLAESLRTEGFDPVGSPLDFAGLSNYRESDYTARDRAIAADPRFNGRTWRELEAHEQATWNAEQGRVYSTNPDIKAQQERADVIASEARTYQEKIDGWLKAGQKPDGSAYTVDDWKLDRAKNDRYVAGQYDQLYDGVDFKDKTLTPTDRYYAAIAERVNPETDEVDWDRVENWLKGQSWEDQAYIARNTNLRDTEVEKEYRTATKAIANSGYFDLEEGKREFREANPEIAALIREWGFSQASIAAEDITKTVAEQQAVDDARMLSGELDRERWIDNYNERRAYLRGQKDAIYAGFEEDGLSTEPLDQWFAKMEEYADPNGVDIDWDAVDAWVAQQPPEVQEAINGYEGVALTPAVADYKADVKAVAESGYFDRSRESWANVAYYYPELGEYDSYEDWRKGQTKWLMDAWMEEYGFSSEFARREADTYLDKTQPATDYEFYMKGWRDQWVEANPQQAYDAWQWGWYTPTNEYAAWLNAMYQGGYIQ